MLLLTGRCARALCADDSAHAVQCEPHDYCRGFGRVALTISARTVRPQVTGASPSSPLQDFKLQGIGLRDTAPTMLEPHGVPSGGDWALERIGSIFLQNTVSRNCVLYYAGSKGKGWAT